MPPRGGAGSNHIQKRGGPFCESGYSSPGPVIRKRCSSLSACPRGPGTVTSLGRAAFGLVGKAPRSERFLGSGRELPAKELSLPSCIASVRPLARGASRPVAEPASMHSRCGRFGRQRFGHGPEASSSDASSIHTGPCVGALNCSHTQTSCASAGMSTCRRTCGPVERAVHRRRCAGLLVHPGRRLEAMLRVTLARQAVAAEPAREPICLPASSGPRSGWHIASARRARARPTCSSSACCCGRCAPRSCRARRGRPRTAGVAHSHSQRALLEARIDEQVLSDRAARAAGPARPQRQRRVVERHLPRAEQPAAHEQHVRATRARRPSPRGCTQPGSPPSNCSRFQPKFWIGSLIGAMPEPLQRFVARHVPDARQLRHRVASTPAAGCRRGRPARR